MMLVFFLRKIFIVVSIFNNTIEEIVNLHIHFVLVCRSIDDIYTCIVFFIELVKSSSGLECDPEKLKMLVIALRPLIANTVDGADCMVDSNWS